MCSKCPRHRLALGLLSSPLSHLQSPGQSKTKMAGEGIRKGLSRLLVLCGHGSLDMVSSDFEPGWGK